MRFVPPDLLRMLSFVQGVENWHSGFFAILTLCTRCVETTSWVLWFPLFICASSFLLSCLEPYLSTNASLGLPPGLLSFFLILFSYGNDCDKESAVAFCWFVYCRQRFAQGRRISRQNQIALANMDLIWPSVEGEFCISCHMRLQRPLFPLGCDRGWGKFPHCLFHLNWTAAGDVMPPIPCSCSCGIPLTGVSVHQLE